MAGFTDDPAGLEAHLAARTPAWAERITGIAAADIEAFAADYGTTDRALIRLGYGFSRSRNGASGLHAVSCLPAVRGAWKHRGGGLYGSIGQNFRIDSTLVTGIDDPAVRQLDMSRLGPILTGDAEALG
ncbi:MAG: molybdopterin oxidoreductase family protein, partial [Alphaproteobacteria bacterium]